MKPFSLLNILLAIVWFDDLCCSWKLRWLTRCLTPIFSIVTAGVRSCLPLNLCVSFARGHHEEDQSQNLPKCPWINGLKHLDAMNLSIFCIFSVMWQGLQITSNWRYKTLSAHKKEEWKSLLVLEQLSVSILIEAPAKRLVCRLINLLTAPPLSTNSRVNFRWHALALYCDNNV